MAEKSDGRVIIDTEMNTKPLEASVENIKKALTKSLGAFSRLGDVLHSLEDKMRISDTYSKETDKMVQDTRKVEKEIDALYGKLREEEAKKSNFINIGGTDPKIISGYDANIASYLSQIQQLEATLGGVQAQEEVTAKSSSKLGIVMKMLASKLGTVARKALQGAKALAMMAGRGILNGLKKLTNPFKTLSEHLGKASGGFSMGFKNILKYAFGIRSIFVLINKLRRALVEGMTELAKYDATTNKSISNLKNSLNQLRNSVASAFAPLFNAIAPVLDAIIQKLTSAFQAIAQFMSALTGKKTYMKATKGNVDFAKSLDKTAESAKKAKTYLSGLDEISTFTAKDEESGDAGAGVEGGFEEVAIEDKFKNLADKLKDFFTREDWEGLGKWMADGINKAFQAIYDLINWDNVGERITKFADAFCRTFNSLVDNIDWDLIGRTFGAGLNTLLHTIDLFLTGIDWSNLGNKLGEMVTGFVNEFDWELLGKTWSDKWKAILDLLTGLIDGIDWSAIGRGFNKFVDGFDLSGVATKIAKMVNSIAKALDDLVNSVDWKGAGKKITSALSDGIKAIDAKKIMKLVGDVVREAINLVVGLVQGVDWRGLGEWIVDAIVSVFTDVDWTGITESLAELLGSVIGALISFVDGAMTRLGEAILEAWDAIINWWHDVAFEDGEFTIQGLLEGIWNVIKNIGTWIYEHIIQPFVKGFRDGFGIHSPSTVMAELGKFLIEGLLVGITSLLDKLLSVFGKIKDGIIQKWEEIKTATAEKWESVKNTLSNKWTAIKSMAESSFATVKSKVISAWDSVRSATSSKWESIKSTVSNAITSILNFVNNMVSGISNALSRISSALTTVSTKANAVSNIGYIGASVGARVKIPHLASGTVIPPNSPYLAMVGDQKQGTNVETPLATIKQAVAEVVGEGKGGTYVINAQINRRTLFEEIITEAMIKQAESGRNPFELVRA